MLWIIEYDQAVSTITRGYHGHGSILCWGDRFLSITRVEPIYFEGTSAPFLILECDAYIEIGQKKEARWHVSEVLRINPVLSIEGLRQRLPALMESGAGRVIDALRKAGLPE